MGKCALVLGLALGCLPFGGTREEPRLGRATRAEIEAVLPKSLRRRDAPDPAGRARYDRFVRLAGALNLSDVSRAVPLGTAKPDPDAVARVLSAGKTIERPLARLLSEGTFRVPTRRVEDKEAMSELPRVRALAKWLFLASADAGRRGDHSGRYAAMALRLGDRLLDAGGAVMDGLVALSVSQYGVRAGVDGERNGLFDAAGRQAVLAALPPCDGRTPQLGEAIRRDFQGYALPTLLKPERYFKFDPEVEEPVVRAGTFDPLATARLYGAIYGEEIENARRRFRERSDRPRRAVEAAARGLPEETRLTPARYVAAMNAGVNTIGRTMASSGVFVETATAGVRLASLRNLARAVILLRRDGKASVPDPFGWGDLKVDLKRRLVWSVGPNGKDDGGKIAGDIAKHAPDLGFRY